MKKAFKSVLSLLLCMIMIIGTLITTIAAKGNDSSQAAIEQNGLRLESTNAVGKVLAKAASEQVESNESYGIVGVDINGSTIAVEINNADACTVLVAVYDRAFAMLSKMQAASMLSLIFRLCPIIIC